MKKILIFNGHPDKESFCTALAQAYKEGADMARTGCKLINLVDLDFTPVLKYGYRKRTDLEPDLLAVQRDIKEADHLVFVYPTWWSTFPALLSGFIDRVFLPGFAFKYRENSPFWDKLLTGKTARLIVTMDAPPWYYFFIMGSPGHKAMKKGILEFCGVKPVKVTTIGPIKSFTKEKRAQWICEVRKLGESSS
ncbi:NAD(P)H-dependent oxidoreductase [Candidatus Roizmanbacteria bacterium]|nr:NAD(P)H-dependent oxidoreductase [Candidatus Roizmanbacteria bacterium]